MLFVIIQIREYWVLVFIRLIYKDINIIAKKKAAELSTGQAHRSLQHIFTNISRGLYH